MFKSRNVVLVILVLLGLILASCAPASTSPAAPAEGAAATGDQPVKIRWWHIWTGAEKPIADNWQKLADEYMAAHPNVKIEISVYPQDLPQKLAANMQAGDPPDLFQTWGGGVLWQYADAGLVQDLTDALAQDAEWGESFLPGPMTVYRHEGKIYGVPWRFGMVGLWYNKALFEQAGITETPKTWEDFLLVVQKLKDAGITPIGIGEKDKWPGHFWWSYLAVRLAGEEGFAKALSREGAFNDPAFVEAGVQLQRLLDLEPFQDGHMEATYPDQQIVMGKELAAMELMGQWAFLANSGSAGDNRDNYVANVGWFPFPMVEGGAGGAADAFGGGDGFAIGKNAPPETIDFVKFLTSKEHQLMMAEANLAVLPVVEGVQSGVKEPVLQTVYENFSQAEYLQLYLDQFLPPAVGLAVNDYVQEQFAGTKNAEEVADAIEEVAAIELDRSV